MGPNVSARAFPASAIANASLVGRRARQTLARRRAETQCDRPAWRRQIHARDTGLCAARGARGPGAVYLDRLRHARPGLRAFGERQAGADRERAAGRALWPACRRGPIWRAAAVQLANQVRIEAFGVGQKVRGRRLPRRSAQPDRVRRRAKRQPHGIGPAARTFAPLVPRHAAQGGQQADQRRQPGHRLASRCARFGAGAHARLAIAHVQGHRALAPRHDPLAAVGSGLLRCRKSRSPPAGPRFLRAATRGDGCRRRTVVARGRGLVHADVHADRRGQDCLRARKARLAGEPRPVRMARQLLRGATVVRRVARRSAAPHDRPRSEQGPGRPAGRLLGLRAVGYRRGRHAVCRGGPGPATHHADGGRRRGADSHVSARCVRDRGQPVPGTVGRSVSGRIPHTRSVERGALEHRKPRQQTGANSAAGALSGAAPAAIQSRLTDNGAVGRAVARVSGGRTTTVPTRSKWPSAWPTSCAAARPTTDSETGCR